jgi:ABC-type polysaccharide/polyol phosphate transport system ATPase subunit
LRDGQLVVDRLWKRFRDDENRWAMRRQARYLVAKYRHHDEAFWRYALKDVNLEIQSGESVGLVGPNGSGKSTLLKLITGVIYPYAGSVSVKGRIGALIELRAGIQDELEGRENVYVYGSLLGLKRSDVAKKFDQIVQFADLEDAIDRQVKFYSSGMKMRLGFSVVAHLDPDVLLVDEVLAVGDSMFQQRCHERMREVMQAGTTVVLVSHDLAAVEGTCDRCIMLTDGVVRADGPIRDVLTAYRHWIEQASSLPGQSDGEVTVLKASVTDGDGGSPRSNQEAELQLTLRSEKPRQAALWIGITEGPATPIFVIRHNTQLDAGDTELVCRVRSLPLPKGRFYAWVFAREMSQDKRELIPWHPAGWFDVIGGKLQKPPNGIILLSPVQVTGDWSPV